MWTRVDWEEREKKGFPFLPTSNTVAPLLSPKLPTIPSKLSFHILIPSLNEGDTLPCTNPNPNATRDAEFQMRLFSPPSPGNHWHPQS